MLRSGGRCWLRRCEGGECRQKHLLHDEAGTLPREPTSTGRETQGVWAVRMRQIDEGMRRRHVAIAQCPARDVRAIAKQREPQRSSAPIQYRFPSRAADTAEAAGDNDDPSVQGQCDMSGQHRRVDWHIKQAGFVPARPIRAEV